MIKKVVWGVVFILIAALLQSTVLSRLSVYIHAIPDITLIILVFMAYVNGTMTGQLTGFFSGFLLDFLSSAPLGLNALVRTLVGAFAGFIKGTFFLDIFLLPMALCAGATVFKVLISMVLHLLLPGAIPSYNFFGLTLWVELALNTLLAPFFFALLKQFEPILVDQRENG